MDPRPPTIDAQKGAAREAEKAYSALCSVGDFLGQIFDYIIVGGGTAGLVLANRLSADSSVYVGVIEAGPAGLNNPAILTPGMATTNMYHPDSNWMMKTPPQVHSGNRVHDVPRGKVLGGSSAINYMMYTRGQRSDYDEWEALGNKGWGWDGILPYLLKHEYFDGIGSHFSYDENYHGSYGGIHTSFPSYRCPIEEPWMEASGEMLNGAHKSPKDAWSGDHVGLYTSLCRIDQSSAKGTRSYATTAYLLPILEHKNLKVLTDSHTSRVMLEQQSSSIKATGVEFIHKGQLYQASVSREVILSAGSIGTPQILELSGIGDPAILSKAGMKTVLTNTDVGANFQDHLLTGISYNLAPGSTSLDGLHDPTQQQAAISEYTTSQSGPLSTGQSSMGFVPYSSVASSSEVEATASNITLNDPAQSKLEAARLRSPDTAAIHLYGVAATFNFDHGHDCAKYYAPPPPGAQRFTMGVSLQYPLSRGSVHIQSGDPLEHPVIDPAYLSDPADVDVLCAAVRFAAKTFEVPVLKERVTTRQIPPVEVDLDEREQLEGYVRTHTSTEFHLVGTAGMGRVVDDRLRVKGVEGLRVCDASVFPSQISGNLVATVYAVAEKGADIVKEDWSESV